jgi:hypothetical protein
MSTLKEICRTQFPIKISRNNANEIITFTKQWELRDDNPLALNTSLLGVHFARFFNKDKIHMFDMFNVDMNEFSTEIHKCENIDKSRRVQSNPFNIYCTWLMYNFMNDKTLSSRNKLEALIAVGKMWNYSFFTSLVAHRWQHGAKEDTMRYTIDNLSGKYSIKKPETSTWKLVIEQRIAYTISKDSIHYKTLQHYSPDDKVLYIITDFQSRMRDNINNIAREYYLNDKQGAKLGHYGLVDEIDGDKIIKNMIDSFDTMIAHISGVVLNVNKFLDHELINIVVKLNDNLRADMFRDILTRFSNLAMGQYRKHKDDEIKKISKDKQLLIGYRILVSNIIQKTYRRCILRKVNMKSKLAILETTKNIYSNSRITDQDILDIKNSVDYFIEKNSNTKRDQTKTALKIGFILYIMLLSMKYGN